MKSPPTHDGIKILEHENVFQGYFCIERYNLQFKMHNGEWSNPITREVFERGSCVGVLPYDPFTDEIILIEQFRIGTIHSNHPWVTEIVAGVIEPGEHITTVAKRETEEETGCNILALEPICGYWVSPGGTSEHVTLFCGKVDAHKASEIAGCPEENEDIRVIKMSATDAIARLNTGKFDNALSIISMQWFEKHHKRVKAAWTGT